MRKLMQDIKQSIRVFKIIRKQRRSGTEPELKPCVTIPAIWATGGIYDTVEGCVLANCGREIDAAARKAFNGFPDEQKRRFLFSPCNGEFTERATYWKESLSLYLSEKLIHRAIGAILRQYIKIKNVN